MTIQPIHDAALLSGTGQTSYNAARVSAEEKSFQATLDELQQKATTQPAAAATEQTSPHKISPEDLEAKKLREACEGFEAMFLSMMYKQMRATVPENDLFGKKSNAIEIFEDMRDTELMNVAAKSGGIGIADMMYQQLTIKTR